MYRPQLVEDEIGRKLQEAERNGELRSARGYGEPLPEDVGWAQTPDALRLPFKILKDAGVMPLEIEWLNQRAALRRQLETTADASWARALQARLAALELKLALRLEALRRAS